MDQLPWLDKNIDLFPAPESALESPNGLLALGGDLNPQRLLNAYRIGIFPWYEEDQPILWWSPNPRLVLFPDELHVSRSLRKTLKKTELSITFNQAFADVISACAYRRNELNKEAADTDEYIGTWITDEMIQAYTKLHHMGFAHSVEAWHQNELVGGLYGVAIGKVFCGESMFSHEPNASKIAFVCLVGKLKELGYRVIDCQVASDHLLSLGAREISREDFIQYLPNSDESISDSSPWPLN